MTGVCRRPANVFMQITLTHFIELWFNIVWILNTSTRDEGNIKLRFAFSMKSEPFNSYRDDVTNSKCYAIIESYLSTLIFLKIAFIPFYLICPKLDANHLYLPYVLWECHNTLLILFDTNRFILLSWYKLYNLYIDIIKWQGNIEMNREVIKNLHHELYRSNSATNHFRVVSEFNWTRFKKTKKMRRNQVASQYNLFFQKLLFKLLGRFLVLYKDIF